MMTINFIAPNGEQLTKRHSLEWKKNLKIYLYVHGKFLKTLRNALNKTSTITMRGEIK